MIASARREPEFRALVDEATRGGGACEAAGADVSRRAEVEALVRGVLDRCGRVDVLVNCAGGNTRNRQLVHLQPADWDRVIATNLTGALHCTQAVLPAMRAQRDGLIIHVSSISGLWGDFSGAAYQASKHGLTGLANATMMEERLHGIRVTVIYPGLCDTPLLLNRPVPPSTDERGLMMQPEDIAEACLFAASLPPRTYVSQLVIMPNALQCNSQAVGSKGV